MACSLLFYPKKKPSPFLTYVQWNRWAKDQGLGERYLPLSVWFVIVKTSPYRNPYGIFIELARERRRKRNMSEDFSLFMYKVKRYDTYKSIASILQVVFISCYIGVTYPRFFEKNLVFWKKTTFSPFLFWLTLTIGYKHLFQIIVILILRLTLMIHGMCAAASKHGVTVTLRLLDQFAFNIDSWKMPHAGMLFWWS